MFKEKNDQEIIEKILLGEGEAFREILEKYSDSVFNFLAHLAGRENATDLTQETFIKVWKYLKKFRNEKSGFKTWLFTVARNTAIDFLRKKKSITFSKMEEDFLEEIPDKNILPDEMFAKLEDTKLLNELLGKIPAHYKTILLLHYREEMTFEEIGRILKKPANTVKSYHYRAILELRKNLS